MSRELVIGLDLGTTSVKAVLFTVNGKLIAETEKLIESKYLNDNWVEQDPEQIAMFSEQAMSEILHKANVLEGEVLTVGFSCAMHSLICLDEQMNPLTNAIIWADGRSSEQAEDIMKTNGANIFAKTGTPIHPMTPFMKLLWMKKTNYVPYVKSSYFMSIKEFLLYRWFGERVVDYAMASATGLFNIHTYDWDDDLLTLVGVKREQLSTIVEPTKVITQWSDTKIPLLEGVPCVIGSADGQLANLGSGAISPGEVAISVGTSGAIRQFIDGVKVNKRLETFTYAFDKRTAIIGGPTNNGGIVLQWLKELLEYDGGMEELIHEASKAEVGSDGLLFFPYVNGERAPLWNQKAKGNFFGLSMTHKRHHLVRAVLEGITLNLYQIEQSLVEMAGESKEIYVNGGLSRSSFWVQMVADVFGKNIYVLDTHHSAAWGGAWTALVGIGRVNSFKEIKETIQLKEVVVPDLERHQAYQKAFERFCVIGKDLGKHFI
ncbi:gluconokinase [Halalkalibacter sp. APA_J-10(15)]|uniref:gluconokinase n=1 Tax=Halalkalibacter sp. APA_J-10(15) TaxID=2933805 RepID=UPI001FF11DC6|nr:gluconokinase [Halalkalibacter sp. APA_J-10(15)]MCK0472389.1 gluconokinase [Halalkalibacter sp. APA_J-10(15)]